MAKYGNMLKYFLVDFEPKWAFNCQNCQNGELGLILSDTGELQK